MRSPELNYIFLAQIGSNNYLIITVKFNWFVIDLLVRVGFYYWLVYVNNPGEPVPTAIARCQ